MLKTATLPDTTWFNADTMQALQRAGVDGLWLQLFPSAGKRLFHKNGWRLLWGVPSSSDESGMRYGPSAFQQLIPALYVQSLHAAQAFLAPAVPDWICEDYRPRRMAYLSCSAGTLSRDLQRLCAAGYGVERLQPYDFFPQTWHVECLAMLRREA